MRRIASLLVLMLAITTSVAAMEFYSGLQTKAPPASSVCVSSVDVEFCAAVTSPTFAYSWDIPSCATIPLVRFDIQPGVHSAYLAEMIKPPNYYYHFWQATLNNTMAIQEFSRHLMLNIRPNSESSIQLSHLALNYKTPRDCL